MIIRPISPGDLDLICRHRREMFKDAGQSEEILNGFAEPFREWVTPRLSDGRYFGFIAQESGESIGGIGLMEIDCPRTPRTRSIRGAATFSICSWSLRIGNAESPRRCSTRQRPSSEKGD